MGKKILIMASSTKPVNISKHQGKFFHILQQTSLSQVAVMTIKPGQDSGPEEIHEGDQIVYIVEGKAEVEIRKEKFHCTPGMIVSELLRFWRQSIR